jgi:hypothetical protein
MKVQLKKVLCANAVTFWIALSYSVRSFVISGLKIIRHGKPDNNLASPCICRHELGTTVALRGCVKPRKSFSQDSHSPGQRFEPWTFRIRSSGNHPTATFGQKLYCFNSLAVYSTILLVAQTQQRRTEGWFANSELQVTVPLKGVLTDLGTVDVSIDILSKNLPNIKQTSYHENQLTWPCYLILNKRNNTR